MTIAIHLEAGHFSYITASDTQVTYEGIGAKVDSGKIRGAFRLNPSGAINVAGAGWGAICRRRVSRDRGYVPKVSRDARST